MQADRLKPEFPAQIRTNASTGDKIVNRRCNQYSDLNKKASHDQQQGFQQDAPPIFLAPMICQI
jgi:hypothetical protein